MNILSCLLLICLNNGDTDLYRFRKRIKRIVMTQVFLSGLVDSAYYRMFFMSKEIPGNQFSYIGFRSQGFLWTKGEKGKENASKEVFVTFWISYYTHVISSFQLKHMHLTRNLLIYSLVWNNTSRDRFCLLYSGGNFFAIGCAVVQRMFVS